MLDGESDPRDLVLYHLQVAREITRSGQNAVLAYILEMAIRELEARGLDSVPKPEVPNILPT